MLVISAGISLIVLSTANLYVWYHKKPIIALPIGMLLGLLCIVLAAGAVFYGVLLQALLLVVASLACSFPTERWKRFFVVSVTGTVAIYGVLSWPAYREIADLRSKYPYFSMEDRLPPPKDRFRKVPLTAPSLHALAQLEELIETEKTEKRWTISTRERELEQIHENTVERFINSTGFGVTRMSGMVAFYMQNESDDKVRPQRGIRLSAEWDSESMKDPFASSKPNLDPRNEWIYMNLFSIKDFINVAGFGFVKDRGHVAGFESHRLNEYPMPSEPWNLQSVELIGLVVNDKPVAYVSENLPSMDELRKAHKRPLDRFESLGLTSLRAGDDLFVRDMPAGRRMLGAIRSAKQCLDCHGGKRGELLGAFSYTMTRQ